ncbi:hypothetical protein Tco_1477985, partial [Tanacetum coccineum]
MWQKPPSYTKGEQLSIVNTAKDPKVRDIEKDPKCVSQLIPIAIVRTLTMLAPELEIIGSSSRIQLIDTILEFLIPQPKTKMIGSSSQPIGPVIDITPPEQPKSPQVTPKLDREKG